MKHFYTMSIQGLVLSCCMFAHAGDFPEMGTVKRDSGFWMEGYWCWDASVIKGDDGKYHMFASRWPKEITFHPGWMTDSEVVHAVSDTPEGPYAFKAVTLPARGVDYWDGRSTHNPTIRKHGDTYLLFYMGSTHPLGDAPRGERFELTDPRCIVARAGKRIGLATSKSLDGPWERFDRPILDVQPGTFYSFFTSNPAPVVHQDGSVLLVFKARRYQADGTHGPMMLGVAKAPHYRGPYTVVGNEPIFNPEELGGQLEDPFVWESPDGGYELIAKDMSGRIVGEKHAGVHALSEDGVHWRLAPKAKAWTRQLTFDDGKTEVMGQFERPFILFENGRPAYLIGAAGDGPGGFHNMTKSGNLVIPLKYSVEVTDNPLARRLAKPLAEGGFRREGYHLWDPSIIKVGDTYHMFASCWPVDDWQGWRKSYIIRATSRNLLGPYEYVEEVFRPRPGEFFDSQGCHNPKITHFDGKYYLYYLGIPRWQSGVAVADSVEGPWERTDEAVIPANNPALLIHADGSVYGVGKFKVPNPAYTDHTEFKSLFHYIQAFKADTIMGPYTMLHEPGTNALPENYENEDPAIWYDGERYHMLLTDLWGHATGFNKGITYYTSVDGLKFELISKTPLLAAALPVKFADGSQVKFTLIERPNILLDDAGKVSAVMVSCRPPIGQGGAVIVVLPVASTVQTMGWP